MYVKRSDEELARLASPFRQPEGEEQTRPIAAPTTGLDHWTEPLDSNTGPDIGPPERVLRDDERQPDQ